MHFLYSFYIHLDIKQTYKYTPNINILYLVRIALDGGTMSLRLKREIRDNVFCV